MLTKLWRIMDEHSENFKEIRCIIKYQTEIITELKNTLEGFNKKLDEVGERISELTELREAKQKKESYKVRIL